MMLGAIAGSALALLLLPHPATARIEGEVLDDGPGTPVSGARVKPGRITGAFLKELSFIDDDLWGFEVRDADGMSLLSRVREE